jgi:hypothetical protein
MLPEVSYLLDAQELSSLELVGCYSIPILRILVAFLKKKLLRKT